eukprot:g8451.t1
MSQDSQIAEVTHVVSKAFTDFNASIGAVREAIDGDFGDETAPVVLKGLCKSYDAYAAVADGKIVGVSFFDVHAKGSRVATLGPVSSLAPGVGEKTFVAAYDHAERLGFSALVLQQIAANSRSFSMYAKLGFEYVGGFLASSDNPPPPPESGDGGLTLKAMVVEDIPECADLFLTAHGRGCGWDRRVDMEGLLGAGIPFAMLVARDAGGKVVGYTTGFFIAGHTVAESVAVFCAMFRESSRLHQERGLPCPRFHCPVEFTGLLSWSLAQGLRVFRATIIMARGHYEHTPWTNDGYVVAPTMDLKLEFLDPKTISDSQIAEVTHVVSKAFKDFNKSVGLASEVVDEEFGNEEMAPIILQSICKSYDAYAAVADGKIVGVSFFDVHAKGSRVATLGPVSSLAPGAGKTTFVAACEHAERLGFSALVLQQIAANSRSFSLYAKLGFETKHTCQYVGGFLASSDNPPPPPESGDGGLTLKAMVVEDIPECADLFLTAHGRGCGWDRRADMEGLLGAGIPFAMLVARDAGGKVVGYTTGFFLSGHTVAESVAVFCAMFRESSRLHQERGLPCPRFHCPVEFTGLLSWSLAQGLRVFRATIIMARGHYEHTPWTNDGYVVAPSIAGY